MNLKNIVYKKIYLLELSGVFEITFTKEDGTMQFYICMTNRKLNTRTKKHTLDIKCNTSTTALARLYSNKLLCVDFENSSTIYLSRFNLPTII